MVSLDHTTSTTSVLSPPDLSFLRSLQDFLRVKSLEDAADSIWSLAWNANVLAVGGKDKQLRVYDVGQDAGLWPMRMSFVLK